MVQFVTIGRVTAPHGVRGEVRVMPLTDFPDRFEGLRRVFVQPEHDAKQTRRIESWRWHKQFVVMKFADIDNRDGAEKLRGSWVQVPIEEAHPLPPDTHYVFQLVGLKAYTPEGQLLGVVRDVLATGANDVYIIERPAGGPELLVPAVRHVVEEIDVPRGRIVVRLLPGLE